MKIQVQRRDSRHKNSEARQSQNQKRTEKGRMETEFSMEGFFLIVPEELSGSVQFSKSGNGPSMSPPEAGKRYSTDLS